MPPKTFWISIFVVLMAAALTVGGAYFIKHRNSSPAATNTPAPGSGNDLGKTYTLSSKVLAIDANQVELNILRSIALEGGGYSTVMDTIFFIISQDTKIVRVANQADGSVFEQALTTKDIKVGSDITIYSKVDFPDQGIAYPYKILVK